MYGNSISLKSVPTSALSNRSPSSLGEFVYCSNSAFFSGARSSLGLVVISIFGAFLRVRTSSVPLGEFAIDCGASIEEG